MSYLKQLTRAAVLGGAAMLTATSAQAAELGATGEPIKLAINEWTGQHVTTHIAGQVLEKMGYSVEYVTAGNYPQHSALADGTIHATLEVWLNNAGDIYPKMKETGNLVDIGPLNLETREGWVYPVHMKDVCPGLPDWEALKDCAEAMATPETFPDGRILSYPADWGNRSAQMIQGLDLPYAAVPAGSEGALVAELKAAATAQKPLVMMFWAPHWVLAEVDVEWVELPAYDPACETDASWGPNPNEVLDCGVSPPDTMKVAWSGFADKWPAAYAFLEQMTMSAAEQQKMMLAIDQKGEKLEDVVSAWVAANEATWKPWMDSAMN